MQHVYKRTIPRLWQIEFSVRDIRGGYCLQWAYCWTVSCGVQLDGYGSKATTPLDQKKLDLHRGNNITSVPFLIPTVVTSLVM